MREAKRPTQEWLDSELAYGGKLKVCQECKAIPYIALARHGCDGLSVLELGKDAGEFVEVPADASKVWLVPGDSPDQFYAHYDGPLPPKSERKRR